MADLIHHKLQQLFTECDKHQHRIEAAYSHIQPKLPLTTESYQRLTETDILHIDQFLFRFAKLQDAIGQRLFQYILLFLNEETEGKPFIDILNQLEKLGLIPSAEQWQKLREQRNAISHEYDDSPDYMAQALNAIFTAKDDLIDIYQSLKSEYTKRKPNK